MPSDSHHSALAPPRVGGALQSSGRETLPSRPAPAAGSGADRVGRPCRRSGGRRGRRHRLRPGGPVLQRRPGHDDRLPHGGHVGPPGLGQASDAVLPAGRQPVRGRRPLEVSGRLRPLPGVGSARSSGRRRATTSTRRPAPPATSPTSARRPASPPRGWYSYDLGTWHVVVLNSNCADVGGCGPGSRQLRWLAADLAAHPRACTLAYWHHPRFSSGLHGDDATYDAFWRTLYAAGADLVLAGHDHDYERFAPQDADGQADPEHGIREFVVGHRRPRAAPLRRHPRRNSEARNATELRRPEAPPPPRRLRLAVPPAFPAAPSPTPGAPAATARRTQTTLPLHQGRFRPRRPGATPPATPAWATPPLPPRTAPASSGSSAPTTGSCW